MEELLEFGYIGLFFGSLLAATIFPFSSDALLLGMLIAGGDPIITVAVATVGNWIGGLIGYWMGWLGKLECVELIIDNCTLGLKNEKILLFSPSLFLLCLFK